MYGFVGKVVIQVSLYASWISDSGNLVVLLYSSDSYSYLYQKDHRNTNIYILMATRSETDRIFGHLCP